MAIGRDEFTAWAIDTKSVEGHGLIGRYWCFGGEYPQIPVGLSGCEVALFPTRSLARRCLLDAKRPYAFSNAKVIHVKVKVEQI